MASETAEPYLKIVGVTKKFGEFTALKDISLEVFEKEFVCFLGPSGCGKTTLLRAIAGLDIQTSGQVFQKGRDISDLPPSSRDFGIVFQSYALFPNLTVEKNVAYGLENQKVPQDRIKTRVAELLELVGLPDQGRKYPAQLSGGQQQRVALARALATEPGLLLLDEPLSALDAKVRARLRHEIKELQNQIGVTTIMVTHDQEEALTMADRIVVMNNGVIEQVGSPIDIYSHPASPFVADFIGTTNFIDAKLQTPTSAQIGNFEVSLSASPPDLSAGQDVTLCIRPEDVLTGSRVDGAPNQIELGIHHVEFLGSFHRLHTDPVSGDTSLMIDVSVARAREIDISVGSRIQVALPAEHMNVYPARG
ncbi:MAG: putative 2-aminoethylphosphonate ABC transporter ATP-binding protein [Rhodospirillales bacterium]|nr:putative 2-aminoethylphosphonate ABC transporter ATP-binding protein [Rhodospirillales bacterium]